MDGGTGKARAVGDGEAKVMSAGTAPLVDAAGSGVGGTRASRVLRQMHFILFFTDAAALVGLGLSLFYVLDIPHDAAHLTRYSIAIGLATALYCVISFRTRVYDWRSVWLQLRKPFASWGSIIVVFGVLLTIAFAFKETASFSRLWGGLWFVLFTAYILVSRAVLTYIATRVRRVTPFRRAVIVGAGENGRNTLDHIRASDDLGIRIVGFLDDRTERIPASYGGVPVLGGTDVAEALVRNSEVDLVIIALPWDASSRVLTLLDKLSRWATDIYMAPGKLGLMYADRPRHRVCGMPVISLKDKPISEWAAVVKRLEDLLIAVPAVMVLSPLLLLTALAIKLDSPGPVLFKQKRFGFNNNLIEVYKFRSMYTSMTDEAGSTLTARGDARITRVGAFIRRTSIDELPQLLNVVKGDMSIVGPRPHAVEAKAGDKLYNEAVDTYASRHRVKPGITGWAQCNGWRGETDTEEKLVKRVEHDLYYIDRWSIFFDLLIILKTVAHLINSRGKAF